MERWSIRDVLSIAVVGVALFIIVIRTGDEAARQWAVGAVAFVLGFYLRGNRESLS